MSDLTPFEQGALAVAWELIPKDETMRPRRVANAVTTAVVHQHAMAERLGAVQIQNALLQEVR